MKTLELINVGGTNLLDVRGRKLVLVDESLRHPLRRLADVVAQVDGGSVHGEIHFVLVVECLKREENSCAIRLSSSV